MDERRQKLISTLALFDPDAIGAVTTDEFAAAVARMRLAGVPAKVVQVVAQLATAPGGDLVHYIEFFQVCTYRLCCAIACAD